MLNKIILFILSFHISLTFADPKISDYRKYAKTKSDFRLEKCYYYLGLCLFIRPS